MKPHLEEAWRALRLADRDITAFQILAREPAAHISIVCFHAQQAVEKALKAVLYAHQIEFRRTHNLTDLGHLIRQSGVSLPIDNDALDLLNPFTVLFRYDDIEVTALDPARVAPWVASVRRWAEDQVKAIVQSEGSHSLDEPEPGGA
jgi:HEPN domain-containing protein